jgi:anti-sigma regulatory factor (Ser/Thr protein kinase)
MSNRETRSFRAHGEQMAAATGFVAEFCESRGVDAGDTLRLTLIVEELFTNTLVHGHRGDHDSPVHIELTVEPARLALGYADRAPPFDPLRYLSSRPPQLDAPIDERKPGGLGLPLVAQMCERFDYAYAGGFNQLTLLLRRNG